MEEYTEKICPFMTAGAFANPENVKWDSMPCIEEECALWDEESEACGLRRLPRDDNAGD